jgi:hypothetical protein
MSDHAELLIDKYKSKGILLDANLALLYLVGNYDLKLIGDGRYNKLSDYTQDDYHLLLALKNIFRNAVTTPHVLTEVSNLANDLAEPTKMKCLKMFYETFASIGELCIPSMDAAQRADFHFLGLTDSVLAHVSHQYLIVTLDGRLVKKMSESGLEALNLNHLRARYFFPG